MQRALVFLLITLANCLTPLREYHIRRDILNGVKAPEFSIFDKTGKILQYRIESRYNGLHSVELVAYPSKQVVARLKNKITWLLYEGTVEILDAQSQQWSTGKISQNLQLLNHKSTIEWNGRRLLMEHSIASLTTRFSDENQNGQLLAEYILSLSSVVWANKYTLKVYSNDIPDAIYIFGLTVRDYLGTQRKRKSG